MADNNGVNLNDDIAYVNIHTEGASPVDEDIEIPVKSSNLKTVRYMDSKSTLQIRFLNGRLYHYFDVPKSVFDSLMNSPSLGSYLHAHIKGKFDVMEVGIKIESITIRNFRLINEVTIPLDDLTILIGPNGVGKTTVLEALSFFGEGRPDVKREDFSPESKKIEIILNIRTDSHSAFSREFVINGMCEIRKWFTIGAEGDIMRGTQAAKMCNKDVARIRSKSSRVVEDEIRQLRKKYLNFPKYTNRQKWMKDLDEWEYDNSTNYKFRKDYTKEYVEVDQDKINLKNAITVTYIPAMKDITVDGKDGAESLLSELIELVIQNAEQANTKFAEVSKAHIEKYEAYKSTINEALRYTVGKLERRTQLYMDEAFYKILLEAPAYSPAQPNASIRLQDNGFMAPIERAGSGFQRVYLLSLLDMLTSMRRSNKAAEKDGDQESSLRLIVIDEPELYQHPQRQRKILKAFMKLVKSTTCVVCSTHSPYFIELQRIDNLRLLQKNKPERVLSTTIDDLSAQIVGEENSNDKNDKARTWLDMNATHGITEGFFARLVVLVEGASDHNMLSATAQAMGKDLDLYEISIVACGGKGNIPKIAHIFSQFKIPMYPMWDQDHKPDTDTLEKVLKLNREIMGVVYPQNDYQDSDAIETEISSRCARFEDNLTVSMIKNLEECIGSSEKIEYKEFQDAKERDARNTSSNSKKSKCSCETKRQKQSPYSNRKRVLRSKLVVYRMLREIERGKPGTIGSFAAARVIHELIKRASPKAKDRHRQI